MTQQADLLVEITRFLAGRRMAETTFGRLAVNDGKFVRRLREGRNVTVRTLEQARAFIRQFDELDENEPPHCEAA